jgi:hypothetical protein
MLTKMYKSVEKLDFEQEERNHEYKTCIGRDLALMCRGIDGGVALLAVTW